MAVARVRRSAASPGSESARRVHRRSGAEPQRHTGPGEPQILGVVVADAHTLDGRPSATTPATPGRSRLRSGRRSARPRRTGGPCAPAMVASLLTHRPPQPRPFAASNTADQLICSTIVREQWPPADGLPVASVSPFGLRSRCRPGAARTPSCASLIARVRSASRSPVAVRVGDAHQRLDPPVEVAVHQVGRADPELGVVAGAEPVDPRVLQEPAEDRAHPDVLRQPGHARPERAHAADQQIDCDAGGGGTVERVDRPPRRRASSP